MGKLWAVIRREYVERVRSKWFLVGTFLGPLFMIVITVLPGVIASKTKASSVSSNIVIIDASGTELGERVKARLAVPAADEVASLKAVPLLRVVPPDSIAAAESLATKLVIDKARVGYLVITDSTALGQKARYAGRNASTLSDMQLVRDAVRQTVLSLRFEKEGIDRERIDRLSNVRIQIDAERLDERGRGNSGIGSLILGYLVAFLLYMMIALYGQSILRGVMEEKTTRVAEVVVASVPTDTLLAGKVLGGGAVGITQQLIWVACGLLLYVVREPLLKALGVDQLPFSLPSVSLVFVGVVMAFYLLGFLFYASLFAAVGAMVSNQEDAQQASMPVMVLLVFSVIFMQPMLLAPQSNFARLLSLFPSSAPILMPLRMSMVQVPWYEVVGALLSVAVACVFSIWASARIYRVGLLMYGKRPSLRELVRWVRYAG